MKQRLFRTLFFLFAVLTGIWLELAVEQFGGARAVTTRLAKTAGIALPPEHDLGRLAWTHWDTRQLIIRLQASETPGGSILLLGDSIVEALWTNRLDVHGRTCLAVNAGFAGIGLAELQRRAGPILAALKPRFALLYVGINDAWPDADATAWAAQYDGLVQMITRAGATPIVATILPPEPGFTTTTKSRQTVQLFNQSIRGIAERRGVPVADIAASLREGDAKQLPLTVDGIHPTAEFYREIVNRWLVPAVNAAQGVRREDCISSD